MTVMPIRNRAPKAEPQSAPAPVDPERAASGVLPTGYYHEVLVSGGPVRRAWHVYKFERVIDALPAGPGLSILDIGCSAGSLLSLLEPDRFAYQVGVDIAADQIAWAEEQFGTGFRRFAHIPSVAALDAATTHAPPGGFDCITLVEVIEHLQPDEVVDLLGGVARLLRPGGVLVATTPNYTSTWPLLEVIVGWVSAVPYTEQHVTRFNFFDVMAKLARLRPSLTRELELDLKTTSHFVSPFLAALSPRLADRVARWWSSQAVAEGARLGRVFPFGNLILLRLKRRA